MRENHRVHLAGEQKVRAAASVIKPVDTGTCRRCPGEGFLGFDGSSANVRCRWGARAGPCRFPLYAFGDTDCSPAPQSNQPGQQRIGWSTFSSGG